MPLSQKYGSMCILSALAVIFVSVAGSWFVFVERPTRAVHTHLSAAERALDRAAEPEESDDIPAADTLMDEYIGEIRAAQTSVEAIHNKARRNKVALEAFHLLARHQPILRAIRRRPPQSPLSVIDKARYANMEVQEQIVQRLTELRVPAEAVSPPSNTDKLLACPGCNLIIISLTTLRKDHIGLYGYEKPTTPNIDAFFKDSLKFTSALAPSAWTIPDAVTFFTALFPYTHGIAVREPPSVPVLYNDRVLTLAQILSEDGYRTAAFTGGGDYNDRYNGLSRGFNFYLDETNYADLGINNTFSLGGAALSYAPLRSFVDLSAQWLAENSGANFFLFVQGYDTHCPYTPRKPFAKMFTAGLQSALDESICYATYENNSPVTENGTLYWEVKATQHDGSYEDIKISSDDVAYMTALYDARIAEADFYINKLFQRIKDLGLEKNTIIVLMSEHGEMLGEHGWFMRGGSTRGTSYEPALNFPLLIRHPHIAKPVLVEDPVQTADIMPTLLAMLDISDPQKSVREGRPLSLSAFGDTPTNEYAYAASMFIPYQSSRFFKRPTTVEVLRSAEWKLIKNTLFTENGLRPDSVSYELYNIQRDPYENEDLYGSESRRASELKNTLEAWLLRFATPKASP